MSALREFKRLLSRSAGRLAPERRKLQIVNFASSPLRIRDALTHSARSALLKHSTNSFRSAKHRAAPLTKTAWRCGPCESARKRFLCDGPSSLGNPGGRNEDGRSQGACRLLAIPGVLSLRRYSWFRDRPQRWPALLSFLRGCTHVCCGIPNGDIILLDLKQASCED